MGPELWTIVSAVVLIAVIAIVIYFRSDTTVDKDTYQVAINDVYFRRLFVPLSITFLIFMGVFLIIRGGKPGIEYTTSIKF